MRRKKKDAKINKAVLKMGINVEDEQFVYFNEMLYRIMKAQFVTFTGMTFNKVMQVEELVTQFKIAELTLVEKNNVKKAKKNDLEQKFFDVQKAKPLNLFLTEMFFRTSMTTWKHYMIE